MRIFHVRPWRREGYGAGDGASREHAWNGFEALDWSRLRGERAVLVVWDAAGRSAILEIEWLADCAPTISSFPRRREPMLDTRNWAPVFAGETPSEVP